MNTLALVIFCTSIGGLAHTYIIYPLLMQWLARGRQINPAAWLPDAPEWPRVAVLVAAYNEEKVIGDKVRTLLNLRYPPEKLRVYIGSDCSDDATVAIARAAEADARAMGIADWQVHDFRERRGKPPIINQLAELARPHADVFLLTDASVLHDPDVLRHLVRHFNVQQIGAVDAHIIMDGLRDAGVSRSENHYLSSEVRLKHNESRAWGMMIGPFGGCYALRAECYEPIPPNTQVDDFWLVFRALERGYQAINDLEAISYEGATHHVEQEYRRKKRIASGNFQNLARFRHWVLPPVTRLGFAFFSHKVLRWFGGFLLLGAWLSAAWLAQSSTFFTGMAVCMTLGLVGLPLLDRGLTRWGINPPLVVRSGAYFVAMNIALIHGFLTWWRGVRTSVWQRTERT
jgi:cellulose synthase/poly-beta-1,6-N-acetylglucosamine synthase-like glycosyltransferase